MLRHFESDGNAKHRNSDQQTVISDPEQPRFGFKFLNVHLLFRLLLDQHLLLGFGVCQLASPIRVLVSQLISPFQISSFSTSIDTGSQSQIFFIFKGWISQPISAFGELKPLCHVFGEIWSLGIAATQVAQTNHAVVVVAVAVPLAIAVAITLVVPSSSSSSGGSGGSSSSSSSSSSR